MDTLRSKPYPNPVPAQPVREGGRTREPELGGHFLAQGTAPGQLADLANAAVVYEVVDGLAGALLEQPREVEFTVAGHMRQGIQFSGTDQVLLDVPADSQDNLATALQGPASRRLGRPVLQNPEDDRKHGRKQGGPENFAGLPGRRLLCGFPAPRERLTLRLAAAMPPTPGPCSRAGYPTGTSTTNWSRRCWPWTPHSRNSPLTNPVRTLHVAWKTKVDSESILVSHRDTRYVLAVVPERRSLET